MSTSKEISLILSAKLEASDAVNQAQTIGKQIASSLEDAFEGLGQRIAEKIFREMKTQMSSFNFLDNTQTNKTFAHDAKYDNMDIGRQFRPGSPPPATNLASEGLGVHAGTAPPSPPPMTAIQSALSSAQTGNVGQYLSGRSSSYNTGAFSLIAQHLGKGLSGSDHASFNQYAGRDEGYKVDSLVERVKAGNSIRKFHPEADVSSFYSQDEVKEGLVKSKAAGVAGNEALVALSRSIEALKSTIDDNNNELKSLKSKDAGSLTSSEKTRLAELEAPIIKRNELEDERTGLKGGLQEAEKGDGLLQSALAAKQVPWYKTAKGMGAIAGIGGAALATANFANDFNGIVRRADAGTSDFDRMGSRNLANGNYQDVLAQNMLGGEAAMKSEATRHSLFSTGLKTLGGVGTAVFGGLMAAGGLASTAATLGVAAPVGVPASLIGGAMVAGGVATAISGVKDFMMTDQKSADYMRDQQASEKLKNKEYYDMYSGSMGQAQGSYSNAIGMGSDTYSKFLYGGGDDGLFMRSRNSGLSKGAIQQNAMQAVKSFGGTYGTQNILEGAGATSMLDQLNTMNGMGYTNAVRDSGAYFSGGKVTGNREHDMIQASGASIYDYSNFRGSGMETGNANNIMDSIAGNSGQMGSLDQARYNAYNAVAGGGDQMQNTEALNVRMRTQQTMMDRSNTGAGVEGMAKAGAVQNTLSKLSKMGVKVDAKTRMAMLLGTSSEDDLQNLGVSKDQAHELFEGQNANYKKRLNGMYDTAYGKGVGQVIAARNMGNTTVSSELTAADAMQNQNNKIKRNEDVIADINRKRTGQGGELGKAETTLIASSEISKTAVGMKDLATATALLNAGLPEMIKNFQKLALLNSKVDPTGTGARSAGSAKPKGTSGSW